MPNPWTGKGNPYTRTEVIARLRDTINALQTATAAWEQAAQKLSEAESV